MRKFWVKYEVINTRTREALVDAENQQQAEKLIRDSQGHRTSDKTLDGPESIAIILKTTEVIDDE